jgi:hypothetical protein
MSTVSTATPWRSLPRCAPSIRGSTFSGRYFLDHPEVHDGKTWVLSNQWGTKTERRCTFWQTPSKKPRSPSDKLTRHQSADKIAIYLECMSHGAVAPRSNVHPGEPRRQERRMPPDRSRAPGKSCSPSIRGKALASIRLHWWAGRYSAILGR